MSDDRFHYRKLLQFSAAWVELGVVTEQRIEELGRELDRGDDRNTEHYRYRAFREYLASHRPLSPAQAAALYDLGSSDPDPAMGEAVMFEMVELPECPESVRDRALASGLESLVRLVNRLRLLQEAETGIDDALLDRLLASGDGTAQRRILESAELSREQLERLAADGAAHAVRNMAAARLRRGAYGAPSGLRARGAREP